MRPHLRYIAINSVGGYLFYFFIFAPLYASQNGISLEAAGWIFSLVYGVQTILSYTIGRIFEKFSPNWGVVIGRLIYGIGPLILFFKIDPVLFITAMILASFFDVFYPSVVLFERAIFPPEKRESIYRLINFVSESMKMAFLVPMVALRLQPSKGLFFTQFLAATAFSILFLIFLPKVSTGSIVHSEGFKVNKKNLLYIYLGQLIMFLAFNLAGSMMKSYYLHNVLHGGSREMLISEMFYSFTIIGFLPIAFKLKTSKYFNLVLGSIFMSLFFFTMAIPSMSTFYLAHVFIGAGFFMWQPARDALKFQNAPPELGRWEGFFQGGNIFSRIIFPPVAAYMATHLSYASVFITAGLLGVLSTFFVLRVKGEE